MSRVIKNICHNMLVFILTLSLIKSSKALNQSADSFGFRRNQRFMFSINENTVGYVGKLSTWPNTTLELDAKGQKFLNIISTEEGTANLTLIKSLDREVQEYYNFTIYIMKNNKTAPLFKNFTIKVLDINDNAPVFVTNVSSFVLACYNSGSAVTQVQATDQDSGKNGQIEYFIRQSEQRFAIDRTIGIITVIPPFDPSLTYKVNITAKDLGSPSLNTTRVIKIKVLLNKRLAVRRWSIKGTNISRIPCSNRSLIRNLSIIYETKNGVITADQGESSTAVKVNRLIREPPGTLFCLVVKITCGSKESLLAINTTVVAETKGTVKLMIVSLNSTGYFNSSYLQQLEVQFDRCVALSYSRSRASLSPMNNNTVVIERRYFNDNETRMMNNTNIIRCISKLSVGNTSFQIISLQVVKNQTDATTTGRPITSPRPLSTISSPTTLKPHSRTTTKSSNSRNTTRKITTPRTPMTQSLAITENPTEKTKSSTSLIIAWLFGVLFFIIIIVIVIYFYRRKIVQRRAENASMEMSQIDNKKAPWREIDKGFIATGKELGSGFFGVVLQGTVILDGQSKQCAVKMLKGHATEVDNKELINELQIISRIGYHPNIINLIGACTKNGPALIILEFASNGNLLDYLRENRDEVYTNMTTLRPDIKLDLRTRLKIAYEVAQGMRHLSSKKCVHRDVAARNVLLDEHFVAKVTDFGLSRDVYEEGVYQINSQSKMPLKWMAIESLETMIFTTQSDVWSFGVLLWEIETGDNEIQRLLSVEPKYNLVTVNVNIYPGATPYPGLMGRELFQELTLGHRLEQPPTCPDTLYEIMSRCWIRDPSERPSFQQLCNELGSFLQEEAGYEDLFVSTEANESSETTTNL